MENLEALDMEFKKYANAEIDRYDRACDVLLANLDRLKSELRGGCKGSAIASLDRILKAAQKAQNDLEAKKAEFKEAHWFKPAAI